MLNRIVIMGRLTRDPELRYTQSQIPVASFTLAVERDYADQSGKREADFIDCVAWRSTAEFASKYFSKGKMAVAAGRLQLRDWTDRDGNKRRSAEVVVDNLYFGESRREGDGGQRQTGYQSPPQGSNGYGGGYGTDRRYDSGNQGPANRDGGRNGYYSGGSYSELDDPDGELPF